MTQEKNDAARVDSGDRGALLEGGLSGEGSSSGDSLAGGEPAGCKHDSNDGPTLDTLKAGQCAIIKAVRGHGELRRHHELQRETSDIRPAHKRILPA